MDNNGHSGAATGLLSENYHFNSISIKNQGTLRILGASSSLTLDAGTLNGSDGTGRLEVEGALIAPANFVINGITIAILNDISGPSNITTQTSGGLEFYAGSPSHPNGVFSFQSLTIGSGTTLRLIPYNNGDTNYTNDYGATLQVNNLTVAANGMITADGLGYAAGTGPGAGPDGGQAAGGGHGGQGGNGNGTSVGGASYGNANTPITFGSGGGHGWNGGIGGAGGGALRLMVSDTLTLNGVISANGFNGNAYFGAGGGGAGGSIWVTANTLTGNGTIRANGGDGANSYGVAGGGGGGRIAIYSNSSTSTINLSVVGGNGYQVGGSGSIYIDSIDANKSTVQIAPASVMVTDASGATLTVTVLNSNGYTVANKPVQVAVVNGAGLSINGQAIAPGQYVSIGNSDQNGVVTAKLTTTQAGTRTIQILAAQEPITQQGTVTFLPGPQSDSNSTLTPASQQVLADGTTSATITLTLLDTYGNPIPGAQATLAASGHATLTQSSTTTDSQGKVTAQVTDATPETSTITVTANNEVLTKTATIQFIGTDVSVSLTAPAQASAGSDIQYSLAVNNTGFTAQNVILTLSLPSDVTYVSQTASVQPTQQGNTLTWNLGDLASGTPLTFTVTGTIGNSVASGTALIASAAVSTSSSEINPANNSASASTTVNDNYKFGAAISPASATLSLGGSTTYSLHLSNTGLTADTYTLSESGLDSSWVTFNPVSSSLAPGGTKDVSLTVSVSACQSSGTIPFTVSATSSGLGQSQQVSSSLILDTSPIITVDAPAENGVSGSTSVLFSWRTAPSTTGELSLYPAGHPEQTQTFTATDDVNHSIQVDNLSRNQDYVWTVTATSSCGSANQTHHFSVGNGIIFTNHQQSYTINRDYNQIVQVGVQNTDSIAHSLTTSVTNPYSDLIVNFVDSGSIDETITLQPGQTAQVKLALHAQDAAQQNYQLTANLVADKDSTKPIIDNAALNVQVLAAGDYTIEEDTSAFNPTTLARTYVITNHGATITDLSLSAVDPSSGLPARIMLEPSVDHARLETGQSLRVVAYPIFSASDVASQPSTASTSSPYKLAAYNQQTVTPINFTLHGTGGGQTRDLLNQAANCSGTTSAPRQVYAVQIGSCSIAFNGNNWYCTNRPNITTPLQIPAFLNSASISSATLKMSFTPNFDFSTPKDHSGEISVNGVQVGSWANSLPQGSFSFPIPLNAWNNGLAGVVNQNIGVSTQHLNPGHYIVANNYQLNVVVSNATTFVCADSETNAQSIVTATYGCSDVHIFNPATDVYNPSAWTLGDIKNQIKSIASANNYTVSSITCTQGDCGDPINTRTGAFSFAMPDLSIPTSAGNLIFQRTYSSGAVNDFTQPLGYGWTFNQSAHLIFPSDQGGMQSYIQFQDLLGNRNLFKINGDGSYSPGPGVLAALTTSGSGYSVTTPEQAQFNFDSNGKITSISDPQGHAFEYAYDSHGKLTEVSADSGTRYIILGYDDQGRIISVTDYTGRKVTFSYATAGDLASSTDLLGHTWTYTYDSLHHMTQMTDPSGVQTMRTDYDMNNRAYQQFDSQGNLLTRVVYNADGSATIYDAKGNAQTHSYDSRGVNTETVDPLSRKTDTVYATDFRPTSITNAAGQALSMEWSADGVDLLSKTDPAGNQTINTYDSLHNLTSTTDPMGNVTSYTYNGKLLASKTNSLQGTTTYTYSANGWLASETDPSGQQTSYTYDSHGQRTSTTDALGNTTTYTYDNLGRLIDTIDARGRDTHNVYDVAGELLSTTTNYDPNKPQNDQGLYNIVTSYEYDLHGNQISSTDTYGNTTHYNYDDNGHLIRTTDALGNITTNSYNTAGQLIATTDALGRKTSYTYDAAGQRLTTIDALGNSSGTTTFDIPANTSTASDALGHSATYYYDSLERVSKVVDALGDTTLTTYDANGNTASSTDALGRTTHYVYDGLNRLVKTTDPDGNVTSTVYDAAGNRIATIDPLGRQTTYAYDNNGRLIATTDPLGRATGTEYDQYGRRTASLDAAGNRTTYTYDLLDRVIAVTDPAGNTTTTTYDALGRVLVSTDQNGHFIQTTYDSLGRAHITTNANGNKTTNSYDAVGNLITTTDALGHTTTYTYNAINRRVAVTDAQGNIAHSSFDALGNLTDQTDANGVVTHYEFDVLGRPSATIQNYKPSVQPDAQTNVRTEFTYNGVGNRITVKDPNGHVTTFAYDALNRVTQKTDPLGNIWSYAYDADGNQTSMTDANGKTTNYSYDPVNQLTAIQYPAPDAPVSFTYNVMGQRVSMTDGLGTTAWTYDNLGHLISARDPFGKTVGYTYDAAGNRTGLTYPDGKTVQYSYDPDNHMTGVADWGNQATTYNYDAAGHLIGISRPNNTDSTYAFDNAGRLTALQHNQGRSILASYGYTYDAAGNVVQALENIVQPLPPTPTPTATSTNTSTPTDTLTPSVTPGNTPTNTETPTATSTNTSTPTDTPTDTEIPTSTFTLTSVPTDTATQTETSTYTPPATNTDTSTPTSTPAFIPTATNTTVPTSTQPNTPTSTSTLIPTSTSTLTATPIPGTSSSIASNFNGTAISAGNTIWFNSVAKISGAGSNLAHIKVSQAAIQFSANGTNYSLPVPDTFITISPTATQASTSFNTTSNRWETTVPASYTGNIFLGGFGWQVPASGLPGGINPVTWSGQFTSDTAGVSLNWQWAAAVYTQFNADPNQLGVKPIDGNKLNPYTNSDHAGTPESYKSYVTGGARGGGGSNWTGGYSGTASVTPVVGPVAILSPLKPGFAFVSFLQQAAPTDTPTLTPDTPTLISSPQGTPTILAPDTPTATPVPFTPAASDTPTPANAPTIAPLPSGPLTINYTYDALHRLTAANYSDGSTFTYVYDAAGNVLQYTQTISGSSGTTTYAYDSANQLLTAQAGSSPVVHYTYDANGSLLDDGVKTYAYDSANRLVSVSSSSGTSTMAYNGLGQRLSMSAAGVTTQYVLDNNQVLTATSGGNTTFYLYGMGAVGQLTDSWVYDLPDGTNTPRQLVNASGEVTFAARYSPWGDTLEANGTGNITFGYMGGLMDTATGLLYVGNGQYYDPSTGRFLNHNANPNGTNPYVPWGGEPSAAFMAPLALLSLFYSRKRKRGTLDTFVILLVLVVGISLSLTACSGTTTQTVGNATVTITPIPAQNGAQSATVTVTLPPPAGSPAGTPFITCTVTIAATPTTTSTLTPSEVLDIYTWAGLWTQSPLFINIRHRSDVYTMDTYIRHKDPRYTGIGLAKVSDATMETTLGVEIPCPDGPNKVCGVGLGLRTVSCGFTCPSGALDQDTSGADYGGAYTAMQTRISLRSKVCLNRDCTPTDEFLVAALAENESINPMEVQTAINQNRQTPPPVIIDWLTWLKTAAGQPKDRDYDRMLISEFKGYVGNRSDLGVDWDYVDSLQNP